MKKICFITTGDIKNIATSKRALGLANPLSELGWDVSILMEDTEENRHRCNMECNSKVRVLFFPHCGCKEELNEKNKLLREIDPDIIYVCAFVMRNIVGVGHRCKKIVEHSELQTGIPDVKGVKKILAYAYEYYSLIYADGLLNASVYLQELYLKRGKRVFRSKIPMMYFPYAFNPDVIAIRPVSAVSANEKYKKFVNKVNFTFLGTVTRNYGVFTILEAVAELKKKYDNFNMLILGKGRHYEEAKEYVAQHNLQRVVFMPGFISEEEISDYFSLTTAFVSPMNDTIQDWARCPSKIYLYLPYQKPVITCKIGEPYEVLKEQGKYYRTGDSQDMAAQMVDIIEKHITSIEVDPQQHTWEKRAEDLDQWLTKYF